MHRIISTPIHEYSWHCLIMQLTLALQTLCNCASTVTCSCSFKNLHKLLRSWYEGKHWTFSFTSQAFVWNLQILFPDTCPKAGKNLICPVGLRNTCVDKDSCLEGTICCHDGCRRRCRSLPSSTSRPSTKGSMHACLLCFCIFCRVIFLAWIFLALANPQLPEVFQIFKEILSRRFFFSGERGQGLKRRRNFRTTGRTSS